MSDSEESGITHTTVSSLYEDLSDIGSPRADDHELLEPPYMLEDPYAEAAFQAPPSPDYVPGPEEPEQAPPSPDYVPGPELADDEIVAGDQPYAEDASPMAHSPDDVPESDPEADPEEDDDEDPEEDPIDYSADGGDDGDDEMDIEEDEDADMDIDEEDEDDEMDDEEAEEEHSAPAYPVVVAALKPATAPSAEETEPFETDESAATPPPHPAYRMTARISTSRRALLNPHGPLLRLLRLLAITSPHPASPLSPCPSYHHRFLYQYHHQLPCLALNTARSPGYEVGESSAAAAARPAGAHETELANVQKKAMRRAIGFQRSCSWRGYISTDHSLCTDGGITEFQSAVRRKARAINKGDGFTTTATGRHTLQGWVTDLRTGYDIAGQLTNLTGQQDQLRSCTAGACQRSW
ncbi:hypothetical protein Tco_0640676 [Tanacetum coccineum]